ncbi:hypothetical protein [Ancylobacter defluvii]|uniref:Uncharacterized protein n=1 Tax=Ancylobacter defluvii TaxID=1282440 RepID=A0A9W6NC31_9HYPH|nr:hypothetical protein [Ancylobacter defluvii]MBS7589734.1 hypothetical protein [Ancylobacter defluvii]GLK85363.1 hypothetical protein GCM10017653_34330 [Ancylobacter defluvii]
MSKEFPVALITMEGGYDALALGLAHARTVHTALAANEDGWLESDDVDAARNVLFHGIAYLEAAAKWALIVGYVLYTGGGHGPDRG